MKKISIQRGQVLGIYKVLESLTGSYSTEFRYAISKNKFLLKSEVESINSAIESKVEKFKEYDEKRISVLRDCIEFDAASKPIEVTPGQYKIKTDKLDYLKNEMTKLEAEYSTAISERLVEIENSEKWLSELVEVEIIDFANDVVPDGISQRDFETLFPLISE